MGPEGHPMSRPERPKRAYRVIALADGKCSLYIVRMSKSAAFEVER